ncbi:peptidoglycan DD-metalloendopeptidase family protein [Desulfococcaceae bacterium HSG7]|nr:peptidoglycan DD-metalloendopeptidase family protein [Desulfococcaceae bacterium HSG7]
MLVFKAKIQRTFAILCLTLGIPFSILAEPTALTANAAVSSAQRIKKIGVVVADRLNFRQKPNINSKRLRTLKKNTTIKIIGHHKDWLKIKYKGQIGFIINRKRYVRILTPRMEDYNNKVKKIERQIAQSKADVKAFAKKESELVDDLYEIEHILNVSRKRQDLFKIDLNTIAEKNKQDEQEAETLKEQIQKSEKYANKRLVALYKLSNLGHLSLLTSADSIYDFFKRKTALERILNADENILNQLTQSKIRLQDNLDRQKVQMKEKRALEQEYLAQIDLMANKRIERTQLLDYIRTKKKLKRTVIKNLKQAAKSLDRKIKALAKELADKKQAKHKRTKPVQAKHERTKPVQAKHERTKPVQAKHERTKPVQDKHEPAKPVQDKHEPAKPVQAKHEPAKPVQAKHEPAKSVQAKPITSKKFFAQKGLLMMPVKGKIVSRFGSYKNFTYNVTNFRSGIDIQADKGEPIRAVCDGKILFANWFKGYGNMVIIDHNDNYYTVYAHIEDIFKKKGDAVETGEVVATVGDSGSLNGPELYFEVRHHGKPIDPLKWLKTG